MSDKLKNRFNKFKYPMLALVLGLIIMLLPISSTKSANAAAQSDEQRLASVLQKCDGVGDVTVLLSDTGADIVCTGADNATVKFSIVKAVEAFTGFSADSIQVIKLRRI